MASTTVMLFALTMFGSKMSTRYCEHSFVPDGVAISVIDTVFRLSRLATAGVIAVTIAPVSHIALAFTLSSGIGSWPFDPGATSTGLANSTANPSYV